jgi:hypothetical protein
MVDRAYFSEEQRFRQVWLWAALAASSAVSLERWRRRGGWVPAPGVLVSAASLGWFAWGRLAVRVGPGALEVRFAPFVRRRVPLREVVSWQAVTYRPVRDYGGWGIRWRPGGWAYTVSGERGVRIRLRDGGELLVGSRRPEELADAIARAKGERV